MDRQSKICVWVILLGLVNFLAYAIVYLFIGGEAVNGHLEHFTSTGEVRYILQSGHEVSRGTYIYSGIHSISVWATVAAIMLAMLTLAKERIASSMRSAIIRGRTFITILATIITFTTVIMMIWFILQFSRTFASPRQIPAPQTQSVLRP